MDEEHSSKFFAGLVDRVQLGGVEVQALATGTDLEAWHAKLLNLHYNLGPIQFLRKKAIFVAYCSFYLLHCQSGRLHRKSPKANESGRIPMGMGQGGITCGAIDEPRKSSKAIDERVIINFRDKNGVIARFRDKNVVIVRFCDKNVECLYIYYGVIEE